MHSVWLLSVIFCLFRNEKFYKSNTRQTSTYLREKPVFGKLIEFKYYSPFFINKSVFLIGLPSRIFTKKLFQHAFFKRDFVRKRSKIRLLKIKKRLRRRYILRPLFSNWISKNLKRLNKKISIYKYFYGKFFSLLKHYSRYNQFFYHINVSNTEISKFLWLWRKRARRTYFWLFRRAFTVKQKFSYYRFQKLYPRLNKINEKYPERVQYLIRNTAYSNLLKLYIFRLFRLAERFNFCLFQPQVSHAQMFRELFKWYGNNSKFLETIKKYFCLFLGKKRNNFYLTLTNGFGETIFSMSSGTFLLKSKEGKRNKKTRGAMKHFVEFLRKFANTLRKKRVVRIKYFFRPKVLKRKFVNLLIYIFSQTNVVFEEVVVSEMLRHSLKKKKDKVRRL